jgi:hypothetical protein
VARLKATPEDFVVEEVPLYSPSGAGDHTWVEVEKRLRTTEEVAAELARAAGTDAGRVGWAGRKDREAVARQWLSVPGLPAAQAARLEGDGWRVLRAAAHGERLRAGELAGNRFRLVVREVGAAAASLAAVRLADLLRHGMPNYFGDQRFGDDGANVERGARLLRGEAIDGGRRRQRLYLSALQSAVFNEVLRTRPVPPHVVLDGDLALVAADGGAAPRRLPFASLARGRRARGAVRAQRDRPHGRAQDASASRPAARARARSRGPAGRALDLRPAAAREGPARRRTTIAASPRDRGDPPPRGRRLRALLRAAAGQLRDRARRRAVRPGIGSAAVYDVVISARDEAPTIAAVVAAARAGAGAGRVLVVAAGSRDATPAVARRAGAEVISSQGNGSKALAMASGVAATSSDVLVFFDADILGMGPSHFEQLARPVLDGRFAMCCGLVDYGPLLNSLFLRLPPITGLRAVRRDVFAAIPPARLNGFQIEIMINEVAARGRMPTAITVLRDTDHRSKVDKLGWRAGVRARWKMALELLHCFTFVPLWTYGSYLRRLTILPSRR